MRRFNKVIRMKYLGDELKERVMNREEGLFINTIICEDDTGYGYDMNGECYLINEEDAGSVSRFLWHQDGEGYLVTDDVCDREGGLMRMEELIMGLWNV